MFISIYRIIVEVLNDQNLFKNRIWVVGFQVMSSFITVVISQSELQLIDKGICTSKHTQNVLFA